MRHDGKIADVCELGHFRMHSGAKECGLVHVRDSKGVGSGSEGYSTMTKRWRLGRSAIYGAIAGLALTVVGVMGAPPEPVQSETEHMFYMAGQWLGLPISSALLFLLGAAARNLLPGQFLR